MRRNGFTMVELIFVIIIIGILAAAAIPKFGDIKDRAKTNAEYNELSGLDSAIAAQMEFQKEDYGNILVNWHNATWTNNLTDTYKAVNTARSVLGKILKKNENLQIVAYADAGTAGTQTNGAWDDIFFIKGPASDPTTGVPEKDSAGSYDGKPDKTDVWVFNASPHTMQITGTDIKDVNVSSGEIVLVDCSGTYTTGLAVQDANGTGLTLVTSGLQP